LVSFAIAALDQLATDTPVERRRRSKRSSGLSVEAIACYCSTAIEGLDLAAIFFDKIDTKVIGRDSNWRAIFSWKVGNDDNGGH